MTKKIDKSYTTLHILKHLKLGAMPAALILTGFNQSKKGEIFWWKKSSILFQKYKKKCRGFISNCQC